MNYTERLSRFAEIENLSGKAWEHAVVIDLLATAKLKDCSMHCFHYQQMLEMLMKHLLETKSLYGAYPSLSNSNISYIKYQQKSIGYKYLKLYI